MVAPIDDDEHTKKTDFPISSHISEGNKYIRLSQFHAAISCFDSVLKFDPTNVQSLVGRAKCLIRLGQYQEAEESAKAILQIHPKSVEAFYLKGEAEYLMGDYEHGLISFLNGFKTRPNSKDLRNGYELCRRAILNFDPKVLSSIDADDVKRMSQGKKMAKSPKMSQRSKSFSRDSLFEHSLHSDLKFAEDLLKDNCLDSAYRDLWTYLNQRTRFWRSHNPSIKKKSAKTIDFQSSKAKLMLQECEKSFSEGDYETCILRCFDTVEYLDSLPNDSGRTLRMKARVYHLLGLSFMARNEFSSALEHFSRELKIGEELDIAIVKYEAWRAIGEVHLKDRRFADAKEAFKNCLEFVESDYEEAIIWYKIAECEMNCGTLENAINFAEKAMELAKASQDYRIQFDVKMLLAELAIKDNRMDDAERMYQDALEIAVQNSDPRVEDVKRLLEMFKRKSDPESRPENLLQVSENIEASLEELLATTKLLENTLSKHNKIKQLELTAHKRPQ